MVTRPVFRLLIILCFAIMAFIATNIAYYQYCEIHQQIGLNQANECHSEIDENEIYSEQITELSIYLSEKEK